MAKKIAHKCTKRKGSLLSRTNTSSPNKQRALWTGQGSSFIKNLKYFTLLVLTLAGFLCLNPNRLMAQKPPQGFEHKILSPLNSEGLYPGCSEVEFSFYARYSWQEQAVMNMTFKLEINPDEWEITDMGDFTDIIPIPGSSTQYYLTVTQDFNSHTSEYEDIFRCKLKLKAFDSRDLFMDTYFYPTSQPWNVSYIRLLFSWSSIHLGKGSLKTAISDSRFPPYHQTCNQRSVVKVFVEDVFYVDTDYCFTSTNINRSELRFAPGAKMVVKPGVHLLIDHAIIESCNDMWESIIVEPGGELIIRDCIIKDGINAIVAKGGSTLSLEDVSFIDNHVGVRMQDGEINVPAFSGNSFTGENLVKPPFAGTRAFVGIILDNVPKANLKGHGNTFSSMDNGIVGLSSSFEVEGCSFANIQTKGDRYSGNGIYLRSEDRKSKAIISGNHFTSCEWGIQAEHIETEVTKNTMAGVRHGIEHRYSPNRKMLVTENRISATQHAIFVNNNPSFAALIYDNPELSVVGKVGNEAASYAVRIESPSTGITPASVLRNTISVSNAENGLYLNGVRFAKIQNNTVNIAHDQAVGINTISSHNMSMRCNEVFGENGERVIGINDANSARGEVSCNEVNGGNFGINFTGMPDNTQVKGNQMFRSDYGLAIQGGGTAIGQQPGHGNLWYGTVAAHFGSNFRLSKFFVNAQPNTGNPLYPPLFTPTAPGNSDWFDPSSVVGTYVCDGGGACPQDAGNPFDPPAVECTVTKLDKAIADGSFYTEGVKEGLYWNARKHLYEKAQTLCPDPAEDPVITGFVQKERKSTIGKLYDVQKAIESLEAANAENPEGQTSFTEANAATILALNNAVEAFRIYEVNEKQVNAIYLQTLLQSKTEIEPEQLSVLRGIASQCPDDGGEAVYRARVLYAFYQPEATFDDAITCDQSSIQDRSSQVDVVESLKIYPNPAKDQLTVRIPQSKFEPDRIVITNSIGEMLFSKGISEGNVQMDLNISGLDNGVYFIQTRDGKSILDVKKFVVIR